MIHQTLTDYVLEWFSNNSIRILIILASLIIGIIVYLFVKKQIKRLIKKHKLEENTAKNLSKLFKYGIFLIVFTAIVLQFAESLGLITALFTLVGGTIIGFAAMNTIGNMIAGLIIMISKPYTVGDRILYKGKIADVVDIKLIYTVLEDLDGVEIHVPNLLMISEDITNYRRDGNIVRISTVITPGFEYDSKMVEEVLIMAGKLIPETLETPAPYVWINQFQPYAVEYELFIFIKDIKKLPIIRSNLHKVVLEKTKEHNIDISTPILLHQRSY